MDESKNRQAIAARAMKTIRAFAAPMDLSLSSDLICFSNQRWDFLFQRPQHLMSRFAKYRTVYYFEDAIFEDVERPKLEISHRFDRLFVVVPCLPKGARGKEQIGMIRDLLDEFLFLHRIEDFTCWYYSPMMLAFSDHLRPNRLVYDCMADLAAHKEISAEVLALEDKLFSRADCVFTSGHSLYELKKDRHPRMHAFNSSIDFEHFAAAREPGETPEDLDIISRPRIGFFGVIDERCDLKLLEQTALLRPDWQLIMIGPVAGIAPSALPRVKNIHYLGRRSYTALPDYLRHWDVAMLPFEVNELTRYSSPTKLPEYLAAGRPVVSTPIPDVVRFYGNEGLVHIAHSPEEFVRAVEIAQKERLHDPTWLKRVDGFLSGTSWDETWGQMARAEADTPIRGNLLL